MSATVRVMTPTKARVRRAWKVLGRSRLDSRSSRGAEEPPASVLGEGVAGSADRQDEHRGRRIVLDLVA